MIIPSRRPQTKNDKSYISQSSVTSSDNELPQDESEFLSEIADTLNQTNTADNFIDGLMSLKLINDTGEACTILKKSPNLHKSITELLKTKLANNECLQISLRKWFSESGNLEMNRLLCDLIDSPVITAQYMTSLYDKGLLNNSDKRLLQPEVIAEMSQTFIKQQFAARTLQVAMLKCIAADNEKAVNKLLSAGLPLEREQDFQLPWLHTCIHYDSIKVVKLLIKRGIDINQKDFNGIAPIHIAAKKNHHKTLKLLLTDSQIKTNLKDDIGNSAIIIAANNESWECLGLLLDSVQTDINQENLAGKNLLSCLIFSEQEQILSKAIKHSKLLIKSKHLINAIHRNNKFVVRQILQKIPELIQNCESEVLAVAVSHGHLDIMKMLIESGANINTQNARGSTPLHIACEYSQPEIVKTLLSCPEVNLTLLDYKSQNVISIANEAAQSTLKQIENSNEVSCKQTKRFADAQAVLTLLNNYLKTISK